MVLVLSSAPIAIIYRWVLIFCQVRDELEHLLDDDEDMAEMYLTDKLMQQHLDGSSVSSLNDTEGIDDSVLRSDVDAKRYLLSIFVGLDTNQNSANSSTTRSTYFYANLTLKVWCLLFIHTHTIQCQLHFFGSPCHFICPFVFWSLAIFFLILHVMFIN